MGPAGTRSSDAARPVRLLDLVMTSAAVAGVSGRRDKTARLADLLARLDTDDVETAIA